MSISRTFVLGALCVVGLAASAKAQGNGKKEHARREKAPAATVEQQGEPRRTPTRVLPTPMSPNGAPVQTGGATPRGRREPVHKPEHP